MTQSQMEFDFTKSMALKLHLNRRLREKEKRLRSEYGDLAYDLATDAMKRHPKLSIESALTMLREFGG